MRTYPAPVIAVIAVIAAFAVVTSAPTTATHAGPNIIRVNAAVVGGTGDGSSWANAAPDLGFVMFNHTEPAEFWVAAGTYDPFTNSLGPSARRAAFRIRAGQAVYGGFAGTEDQRDERNPLFHAVTLTGERGPAVGVADNYNNVVRFVTTGTEKGVLDGVTVTRGFDDFATPSAGGIVIEGGTVTTRNVTVRDNYDAHGGGIHVMGGDTTIEFSGIYQNGERGVGSSIYEAGQRGADSLKGATGRDRLSGGPGEGDRRDGGPGTDALLPKPGCETVTGIP